MNVLQHGVIFCLESVYETEIEFAGCFTYRSVFCAGIACELQGKEDERNHCYRDVHRCVREAIV